MTSYYRLAANALLVLHALYVVFVIAGFVLTVVGGIRGWGWVRGFRFRLAHLASIGIVVLEVFAKLDCPLTVWEQQFRRKAGDTLYQTDFMSHWTGKLVSVSIPEEVAACVYIGFCVAVAATWWKWPPNRPARQSAKGTTVS